MGRSCIGKVKRSFYLFLPADVVALLPLREWLGSSQFEGKKGQNTTVTESFMTHYYSAALL
jgi:hypothetical protein